MPSLSCMNTLLILPHEGTRTDDDAALVGSNARPCWDTPAARCPAAVSAPDGHGMILIERRVDIKDATYRVIRAGPDR